MNQSLTLMGLSILTRITSQMFTMSGEMNQMELSP